MPIVVRTGPLKPPRFRSAIFFSMILHVALLSAISASPDISLSFFKEKPLRIDVMWVELPRGTSDDIGLGLKKAEGLPKSTIEEQKNLFQPEPVKQQTLSPELKAPPEVRPPEKVVEKKVEQRPQIDTSRMIRQVPGAKPIGKSSPADRKIRDALAKIDKQLSGRQIVPESGQVAKNMDGYKYGTSDKPLRVSPSDPEYLKYQAMVRAKILRAWIVPSVYSSDTGIRFRARLEVLINNDGDVVSTRWEKGSGNSSFDQSAIRAIRNASPFPRPPGRLAWEAYTEGFLVEFDPRMKAQ